MDEYDLWNKIKKEINASNKKSFPKIKEIWWCNIGLNIGSEVYGKGERFTRPVLVMGVEKGDGFLGIPLSSKIKNSEFSCTIRTNDEKLHSVLLNQARRFDKKRLIYKCYKLNQKEYDIVLEKFESFIKNITAHISTAVDQSLGK